MGATVNYNTINYRDQQQFNNFFATEVSAVLQRINEFNLTKYDDVCYKDIKEEVSNKKSVNEIAKEVIAGKWGNGVVRKTKLTLAGYNYKDVQSEVNRILKG